MKNINHRDTEAQLVELQLSKLCLCVSVVKFSAVTPDCNLL